jgi:2-polyprenyl-6-methoxyphenol 4-hydroxylase
VNAAALDCDVLIAGGGMVGISLALALDQLGGGRLRVVVAEGFAIPEQPAPIYRPSFDARVTALAYGSRCILERLELWDTLAAHVAPITDIHVSERARFGSASLNAGERGWPALGYVVENAWLGSVLLGALRHRPGITLLSPATVLACRPGADAATAVVDCGGERRELRCALVAIADGAESGLRQQLGIGARTSDYHQRALIANVVCGHAHRSWAYERFTDWGPMALLPLPDDGGQPRMGLVWTMPPARAEQLLAAGDDVFLETLQQRFGHRQGRFLQVGRRHAFELRLVAAEEQVRRQLVLVGNAAHSLHPVAGQGFNLALRDVQRLAEVVTAAVAAGEAPGALAALRRYQRRQAADQAKTILFSDRVTALFEQPRLWAGELRRLGLLALDLNPALKNTFIDQTAGYHPGAALGHGSVR